jgi:LuxR family transcriptional regulator, maltose regulon positive regulatory protein
LNGALTFRFSPPQHLVRIVRRPMLLDRLDEGLRCRCSILEAPAGYGKTVLLSQWREQLSAREHVCVWVALDRDDGGLGFMRWLRAGLAEAGLMSGAPADAPIHAVPYSDAEEILTSILHGLEEVRSPVVLILDEYHLAQTPETDLLLGRLVREMPSAIHVVLSTRNRPVLPLAALRAQGQLNEIGPGELRFSDREAKELLQASLDDAQVSLLNSHVEGWAIALQLANFRIREPAHILDLVRNFSGSIDDMAEYMANQIFAEIPSHLQTFLVETSILDRLDNETADRVRGRSDSGECLAQLRRLNALLAPADRDRRTFRHHHLFAEFLASRQQLLPSGRLCQLHNAASGWFEHVGDPLRAVRHARLAGDAARVRGLVEAACTLHLCLTEPQVATTLLSQPTDMEVRNSLRLQLAAAILRFKRGDLPAGRYELERARALHASLDPALVPVALERDLTVMLLLRSIYQDVPVSQEELTRLERLSDDEPDGTWLPGLIYIMRCLIFLRRGELDTAKTMIFQAIRNLHETDSLYARMFSNLHLGTVAFWQGRLAEAHNAFRTAEEMALELFPGNTSVLALAQVLLAEVAYEQNNVTHATELLRENMRVLENSEVWSEIYLSGYRVATAIALAGGDESSALTLLDRACEVADTKGLVRLRESATAQRIGMLVAQGRVREGARLYSSDIGVVPGCEDEPPLGVPSLAAQSRTWREREQTSFALARLRLAQHQPREALEALASVAERAREQNRMRSFLHSQLLRALALRELGEEAEAFGALADVLEWGAVEGVIRLFVDEGPRVAQLLADFLNSTTGVFAPPSAVTRYAERLMSAFGDLERSSERARLKQLLTSRESQILREVSQGASNKVIARTLDISEDGIKFHLKNVYRKLGVNSRVMALTVAQKLDLL